MWDDPDTRLPLLALVRASLVEEAPESLLQQGILRMVLAPLRAALPSAEADRRVQLVLSQMVGLVVTRYLLALEPLASMPAEEVVAWVAPTLQRYLDGPLLSAVDWAGLHAEAPDCGLVPNRSLRRAALQSLPNRRPGSVQTCDGGS